MSVHELILRLQLNPGVLSGISFGQWMRLLATNRLAVDPAYLPRALVVSATSVVNSVLGAWEGIAYGPRWRTIKVKPPLFVLGVGRSGTTHLHNLLCIDSRFACINFFQTRWPRIFLSFEWIARCLLTPAIADMRLQDNVLIGFDAPSEDEFALSALTLHSHVLGDAFPKNRSNYERYCTYEGFTQEEAEAWKQALTTMLQKLTLRYRRPLILKSPAHTGRIRFLLEAFPDARFVFIHRNPYHVFRSARHCVRAAAAYCPVQASPHLSDEWLLDRCCAQMDSYFAQRPLIPEGHLCEIAYDDLVEEPTSTIRTVYESLGLPEFQHVEPALNRYIGNLSDYRKNTHQELPVSLRDQLRSRCPLWFEEWGYAT